MSRYLPLICLALTHTVVDACALLIAPLWPRLEREFGWAMAALSLAFVVQSMPTSVSQAVFGFFRDRRPAPVWLWLGPVAAAVFLPLMGAAPNTAVLFVLLIVGGIGVGAFHPEAAVAAGKMFPENRTRALSVFMFGGSLGLALGPTLSGTVVDRWGLPALAVVGPVMLAAIVLLRVAGRLGQVVEVSHEPRTTPPVRLRDMLEGRMALALMILMICSLRLVPNMAMDKVISFTLDARDYGDETIGRVQALFLVSASAAMFVLAFRFPRGWERRFMIGCPLLGMPLLGVLAHPACPPWLFLVALSLTGVVLWGTTPAMVSYAQQQFPKGAGVASAITMGLAWGVGGLIQAPITAYFQSAGQPQQALLAFLPCLAVAAIGAWLLPTEVENAQSTSATVETTAALPAAEPADA